MVKSQARLLILDPLQAYLGTDVDIHRANEVRPAFRCAKAAASSCIALVSAPDPLNSESRSLTLDCSSRAEDKSDWVCSSFAAASSYLEIAISCALISLEMAFIAWVMAVVASVMASDVPTLLSRLLPQFAKFLLLCADASAII